MPYEQVNQALLREQEKRRMLQKEMMKSSAYNPYQQVSGRSVPYSPIQGLSSIAKAMIQRSAIDKSDERTEALTKQYGEERGQAFEEMMDTYQGREEAFDASQMTTPEREGAIEADPLRATMMAATDPYLEGAGSVLSEMRGSERGDYSVIKHITKPDGTTVPVKFNTRTQETTNMDGTPYTGSATSPQYSPDVAGSIAAAKEAGKTGFVDSPLTPAQKAVDTEFGKEYAAYKAAGGYADVAKGLEQLKEVHGKIVKEDLTGPTMSLIPDIVQKFTHSDAIAARGLVEEVVQRNLRLILGAQFTKTEGENLIARAYDEGLKPEENKRRLTRLMTAIQEAASAKESAGKYYEENGTLRGWTGRLSTQSDFDNLSFSQESPTSTAPDDIDPALWDALSEEDKALWTN